MGLFKKPAWQSEDKEKAFKAIEKLVRENAFEKNQSKVIKVVKKIDDQTLLANIARKDLHRDVCLAAIERITEKKILNDLAKNGTSFPQVRIVAIEKIDDQEILTSIVNDVSINDAARKSAAKKLTDENLSNKIIEDIHTKETIRNKSNQPLVKCPKCGVGYYNNHNTGLEYNPESNYVLCHKCGYRGHLG